MEVAPLRNPPFSSLFPLNIRQYAYTLAGGAAPMTEKDFVDSDLATLKEAITRKIKQTGQVSGVLSYGDYDKDGKISHVEQSGVFDSIYRSFVDPIFRIESTLGTISYTINKNGDIEIHDAYDFAADQSDIDKKVQEHGKLGVLIDAGKHSGAWGILNAAGNIVRPAGTGTPFTLNLGKYKKD